MPSRRNSLRLLLAVCVVLCSAGALLWLDWWICMSEGETAGYVGREKCAECHPAETEAWIGSDHDRAMDLATPENVLGSFDDQEFTHQRSGPDGFRGATSKMSRRGDEFFVTTDNAAGQLETFPVKYVFGVHPLQQYLVEFPDGRVQCLPIAWDTKAQRWFHLYPDEDIPAGDQLHWTGPLQNWNYMCAECHSTDLQKNYDLKTNSYHTTFSEIDVSCETCHGPGSLHVKLAESRGVFWDRRIGYGLPRLKSEDPRVEVETCAPCHSRRRIVYPGYRPGEKFLDHYMPELLDNNLYYADGQILEEDYVYGSFIQSRMHREKVRCSDCHDPHTARVKFDDNRLCCQCHLPATYDTVGHHHHSDSSKPGTLCVECHMPETTYMVVDPRRDHSLRIPRPDLTLALGIPNACTGCHHDETKKETPQWAEDQVRQWYGPLKGPPHFAHAIAAGREGRPEGQQQLEAVIRRKDISAAVRASAILLLGHYPSHAGHTAVERGLKDPEALVRAAAVRAMELQPPELLHQHVTPLLRDPVRAVRVEAARILTQVPMNLLGPKNREAMDAALAEYLTGQESMSDQAAAHLNMAVVKTNFGQIEEAEGEYQTALRLDPQFFPARANLAMLYNQQGRNAEAEEQLRRLIELQPEMADAHYSLGLLLAEDESRLAETADSLARAAELAPNDARIHYNHGLALQRLQRPDEAERSLKKAYELMPAVPDYLHALTILYVQQERWSRALKCAEELARRHRHLPQMQQLRDHIKQEAQKAAL